MFGNPDIWMNSFAFLFYYSDYIKTHFHYIYLFSISAIREHIIVQYSVWAFYNMAAVQPQEQSEVHQFCVLSILTGVG